VDRRPTREARRSQLLGAARAVFAERGYEAARLPEVAERAGVSERLLYKHFASKSELFLAVAADVAERVAAAYRRAAQDADLHAIRVLFDLRFTGPDAPGASGPLFYSRTYGPFGDTAMNEAMARAYRTMAEGGAEFFAALAGRGLLRPGTDPQAAAWTLASIFREYESIRLAYPPAVALRLGRRVVEQFIAGIAAPRPSSKTGEPPREALR
jgi:AcrR family transcriptional regulator